MLTYFSEMPPFKEALWNCINQSSSSSNGINAQIASNNLPMDVVSQHAVAHTPIKYIANRIAAFCGLN
jgi:hypothetical protein